MIRSRSNLTLAIAWFFVWGIIISNAFATNGFWVPVPDIRDPGLLFLSLFFYGPPLVIIASETAARREIVPQTQKALRFASAGLLAGLIVYAAVIIVFAVGTL